MILINKSNGCKGLLYFLFLEFSFIVTKKKFYSYNFFFIEVSLVGPGEWIFFNSCQFYLFFLCFREHFSYKNVPLRSGKIKLSFFYSVPGQPRQIVFSYRSVPGWSRWMIFFYRSVPGRSRQIKFIYLFIEVSQVSEEFAPGWSISYYSSHTNISSDFHQGNSQSKAIKKTNLSSLK